MCLGADELWGGAAYTPPLRVHSVVITQRAITPNGSSYCASSQFWRPVFNAVFEAGK
jgi:hypothetical protein